MTGKKAGNQQKYQNENGTEKANLKKQEKWKNSSETHYILQPDMRRRNRK
jgi:hypothetical protein